MYVDDIKLFDTKMETLIQTIRIYSQDVGIEFDIEKCVIQIIRSGKRQITEGIEQPNDLIGFYGISTFVGYFMPNQFLYKKQFYFKQFTLA